MLMFDTVVQTQFGSFFKAFALPTDVKPTTGVAPGSKIEEMNPATGAVDTYRFSGEEWVKIDENGTPTGGGGSGGGVLIVHNVYADGSTRLDATYEDIIEAAPMVFLESVYVDMGLDMDYSAYSPLLLCGFDAGYREVTFVKFSLSDGSPSKIVYFADSDSDYPVLST